MCIILVRLSPASWSYGSSLSCARHCRLDPSSTQHGAYVDDEGVFHYQHIDTASSSTTTLLRFQLQYRAEDGLAYEPVNTPWLFEFVPGAPGDLLLVQQGSCRILYASLPKQGVNSSDVFLFGSHTAPVRCLSCNGNILLSGCQGGVLKLWRLSDGQLADSCSLPDKSSVTCITCLGPLLVAAGSSSSTVTLYDLAAGRLLAVQRLLAGPGSIQTMAAWVPQQLLAQANLAPGGPLAPDGGGVLTAAGLGGYELGGENEDAGPSRSADRPLLAVASTSGWLCVYGPGQQPHQAWSVIHSTGSLIAPGASTQLAFSPDGATLAVASPVAQVLGTDAVAVAAAGGQPGAVSLYEVARTGGTASAMVPPLLLEQEQRAQLPELQLWHQWGLSSTPVGLAVLPGGGLELMHGKQLQPGQVLRLYVVPAIGSAQVLHTVRKVRLLSDNTHSTAQHDTVPVTALPATHQVPSRAAAASHMAKDPGQHSTAAVHASTSSSQQQEELEDALLLNIAERDLADVASAIAAAAGPCLDAELSQLLAGATAQYAAPAASISHGVAAACGSETVAAAAAAAAVPSTGTGWAQHSSSQQAGTGNIAQDAADVSTVAPAAAAAAAAATAGSVAFKLPQTQPVARRWREPDSVSAGQKHLQQDLTDLAKALQEEQELMRQEQQQASQRQALQQQQQDQQQAAEAADLAHGERTAGDVPSAAEQELPSQSSFQHLLQQQAGQQEMDSQHTQQAHDDDQQQEYEQEQEQQQQQERKPQVELQRQGWQADEEQTSRQPSEATRAAGVATIQADGTAAGSSHSMAAAAASAGKSASAVAGTAVDPSGPAVCAEPDPQPRQLPAMLRSQQHPAAAGAMGTGAPAGAAAAAASSSSSAKPAANNTGAHARPAARLVSVTQLDAAPPQAVAAAADASRQAAPGPSQQQGRHFQEVPQQPASQLPGRLTVQERLSLRRQQLLAQKQQQEQQKARGLAAAAQAAPAGGVQRSAALMPASDHPLAAAVENSSRLLAAKIQEFEQLPDVRVDPSGPAALKVAAARLADLDLGPDQQQYCYEGLPDLRDVPTPTQAPRLVPKQLDAHWVASRSLQPQMDTLFKPQDWQQGFVNPQLLLLPAWPTPEQVVGQLLWPGQRPGAWT